MKSHYEKYKNKYGWCKYPFEPCGLGYCWGYATSVDNNASEGAIKEMCGSKVENDDIKLGLKKGDYYCEYYNNKEAK